MKPVDHTTWCEPENKAGKYLADTLTNICDEKLVEKVSVYFHRYRQRIKRLNALDKKNQVFYLGLLLVIIYYTYLSSFQLLCLFLLTQEPIFLQHILV